MTYSDSDDFLSEPRVSKLKKKKKTKDKDIKRGKAHTSTQSEEPTVELSMLCFVTIFAKLRLVLLSNISLYL